MKLKDIDVRKLKGVALDYAVAKATNKPAVGVILDYIDYKKEVKCCVNFDKLSQYIYSPSTRWSHCGRLIDHFKVELGFDVTEESEPYYAVYFDEVVSGGSYQEAVCRVIVHIHGCDGLSIPDELLKD